MIKEKTILGLVFVSIVCIILILSNNTNNKVIIESSKSNSIVRSNALAMMLETEAGSGEYVVSSDTTWPQEGYTFNGELSGCENGSKLTWDDENKRVVMSTSVSDKCYVYFDAVKPMTLAEYIISGYTADGENGLYLHDGSGTYTNADLEAGDNSYRYAGADPNNYVCFGSDAATCPTDNLYRIIGVFDDTGNFNVKLIKYDYATSDKLGMDGDYYGNITDLNEDYRGHLTSLDIYYWNNTSDIYNSNIWSTSKLNLINLNLNFYNSFSQKWQLLIETYLWNVSGFNYYDSETSKDFFDKENKNGNKSYEMKIGLMYPSDFAYAYETEAWNLYIDQPVTSSNNWIYMGIPEWTVSRSSGSPFSTYVISDNSISFASAYGYSCAVRPTFYLNSDVTYVSGSGTSEDPIRVN